ncbi:hypothetical protein LCGC14_2183190 [marine sediment metagenome]|uniref:Uncharacterized protein n=1 Tax=marine sediment metagenome TaxID=412755 RepID=A0A0F9GHF8_9ZZZZ
MTEEEIPEIHIDHRAYHGQKERLITPFDFDEIPVKVEFSIHRMRALDDNSLKEIRRPPPEYMNIWVKLEYGGWIAPVLFDENGRPYIMAPAKHQETAPLLDAIVAGLKDTKPIMVQVYIREEHAEELMELLKVATDFCDYCGKPLNTKGGPHSWLEHDTESIADVYNCRFCETESIRWDKDFLDRHTVLRDMGEYRELKTR